MRRWAWVALLCLGATEAEAPPAWLYVFQPPAETPSYDTRERRTLPGSPTQLTEAEYRSVFRVADWYPEDHPPAPPAVTQGERPERRACGSCHLLTGGGRPENASLAGLPADYIIEQMRLFASGERINTPHNPVSMTATARAISPAQLAEAAGYFAALKPRRFGRVVEAAMIPRVRTAGNLWRLDDAGGTEPIAGRLIEVPDDFARHEMRDPRLGYTAYVPPGSIARGAALARSWGGGGAMACASCHGPDLRGDVGPPLAGRSPSYLARQLYDFKSGSRGGPASAAMAEVTRKMTLADMVALSAYIGSRAP
ncbi:MAG: hypothetical protein A4S16_00350 [Proteobacteria bacterium SG_bin6]|nr:MAG: hypothetical protein A4S16_00350 [Proteobacteria bacterium SG_bin6]